MMMVFLVLINFSILLHNDKNCGVISLKSESLWYKEYGME